MSLKSLFELFSRHPLVRSEFDRISRSLCSFHAISAVTHFMVALCSSIIMELHLSEPIERQMVHITGVHITGVHWFARSLLFFKLLTFYLKFYLFLFDKKDFTCHYYQLSLKYRFTLIVRAFAL